MNKIKSSLCGAALILFLVFSEPVPLAKTLADTPRFFTAHLFLDLLPLSWLHASSIYLLIPSFLFLFAAFLPARKLKLEILPLIFIFIGFSFFPLAYFIHDSVNVGPLWNILFLVWLGLNLWFRDIDYFYASAVCAFLWDMGAGVQGVLYHIPSLPEPYGNHIPPRVVVAVDFTAVLFMCLLWLKRLDFGNQLHIEWMSEREENKNHAPHS